MKSFASDVDKFRREVLEKIGTVFRGAAGELADRIIHGTPVKTGRARANWVGTVGGPSGVAYVRVDPSGDKTAAEVRQQIAGATVFDTIFVTNNVTYVVGLEYGRSRQAPYGMVRINALDWQSIVQEEARKVR